MKSKILLISLLSCMLIFTACGNDSEAQPVEDSESATEQSANEETEEEEATKTDEITIEEQVLYDQDGIKITAKSLEHGDPFTNLKVLIENNSDKDITVQSRNENVNDCMIEATFSSSVAQDKKANDDISFAAWDLEDAGIEKIKDIEFSFVILEDSTFETMVESDMINIQTSVDDSFVQEFDDIGKVLLDQNDIKVVAQYTLDNDFGGFDIFVYVENNSENNVIIQARDVSINGFMTSPVFSSNVLAGKVAYDDITFTGSNLEDNGLALEDVSEVQLSLHVADTEHLSPIFNSEPVTISFQDQEQ